MLRNAVAAVVALSFLGLAGCGKGNIFGWAHSPGSSSDSKSLAADAYTALRDKDYAKALEYYTKMLEADPASAEAIYGYSAATLADAGLDISAIVSNLVKQQSAPGIDRLAPALATASRTSVNTTNLLPDSVVVNLSKIRAAVDRVLASNILPRIIKGSSDGKISPDSPDVNLNVAFCLVLRAAMKVQDAGVVTFTTDYKVANVKTSLTSSEQAAIDSAAQDIASAYQRIKIVVAKLRLGDSSSIENIKKDVNTLFNDLKTQLAGQGVTINADINTDYL